MNKAAQIISSLSNSSSHHHLQLFKIFVTPSAIYFFSSSSSPFFLYLLLQLYHLLLTSAQSTINNCTTLKCIQSEIERVGHKFISGIKKLLEENSQHCKSNKSKALNKLEKKWHNLWIRSLEYLICIETGRCPCHFLNSK